MLKTLNWYVSKNFIFTFLMAMGVLTFGMTGARLIKVFEYISNGVRITAAFQFLLYVLPIALAFTIPWAALVAIMLVFGRLSADNEITAMRACGVSILQIVAPIISIAFALTCLCLYLQLEVGPQYLGRSVEVVKNVAVDSPLALFEPGIPVEFDDFCIFLDSKKDVVRNGKKGREIYGIQMYRMNGKHIQEDITASRGEIIVHEETQTLDIILQDPVISPDDLNNLEEISKGNLDKKKEVKQADKTSGIMLSGSLTIPVEYGKEFNRKRISRRDKHEGFRQLYARSIIERERIARGKGSKVALCVIETELNQRVALALAPMAFLLLGLPLAIRTSRRETSVGLFLSVLLAGLYFGGVLVSDSMNEMPRFFPQYIVWIPPVLYQIFGAIYITKIARR